MVYFKDYPEFRPNLSPRDIFKLGSFGGTYWRPIYSSITNKNYKNKHKKFPESWWLNITNEYLINDKYDKTINKYGVKVGTSLEFWENKNWIVAQDPYGWIQWYCNFYNGRRTRDDERQIKRWLNIAGKNGRFKKWLISIIVKNGGEWNDMTISPKIRQTLQHWGYKLVKRDFDSNL
jgi:hypothetical protein